MADTATPLLHFRKGAAFLFTVISSGTVPCQVDTYKNENTIFLIQPNGYNPLKGDTWNNKSVISLRGFLHFKLFDNE